MKDESFGPSLSESDTAAGRSYLLSDPPPPMCLEIKGLVLTLVPSGGPLLSSGYPGIIKQRENHTDSSREALLRLVTFKITRNKYFLIAPLSISPALECDSCKYE